MGLVQGLAPNLYGETNYLLTHNLYDISTQKKTIIYIFEII